MHINQVRELISKHGIAPQDRYDLPASEGRFPDGAHYRNEISGIGWPKDLEELVDEMQKRSVPVHRVIMGSVVKLSQGDLCDIAQMAHGHKLEIVMDLGVTSISDIGRHAETPFGKWGGWRVRGADNMAYLVQAVLRGAEAGFRAFLLYDEGALWLLGKMRAAGDLPADTLFKVSYTAGYRSPAGARLLEELGADSFNPVTDLELPMLAAIRQTVHIPMDIVIFGWETLGNVCRVSQSPEIIRVAAPCYLKQELAGDARAKVKYCEIIREMVQASAPQLVLSGQGPTDLRVPAVGPRG
jgi:hypothetical protein